MKIFKTKIKSRRKGEKLEEIRDAKKIMMKMIAIETMMRIMMEIIQEERKRAPLNLSQIQRKSLFQRKPSLIAVQNVISASVRGK